jgi:hypothetical protein
VLIDFAPACGFAQFAGKAHPKETFDEDKKPARELVAGGIQY